MSADWRLSGRSPCESVLGQGHDALDDTLDIVQRVQRRDNPKASDRADNTGDVLRAAESTEHVRSRHSIPDKRRSLRAWLSTRAAKVTLRSASFLCSTIQISDACRARTESRILMNRPERAKTSRYTVAELLGDRPGMSSIPSLASNESIRSRNSCLSPGIKFTVRYE